MTQRGGTKERPKKGRGVPGREHDRDSVEKVRRPLRDGTHVCFLPCMSSDQITHDPSTISQFRG